jgi:hypothetical protein
MVCSKAGVAEVHPMAEGLTRVTHQAVQAAGGVPDATTPVARGVPREGSCGNTRKGRRLV